MHPKFAFEVFGFGTWQITKTFARAMFDLRCTVEPELGKKNKKKKFSLFWECLICLFWMKTRILCQLMATMFGFKSYVSISPVI